MRLGYRLEVLLPFTALLIVGWIVASLALTGWLTAELEEAVIRQAGSLARNLAMWSEEAVLTENRVDLLRVVEQTKESNGDVVYIFIHGPSEEVVAHSFGDAFPTALAEAVAGRKMTRLETEEGSVVDISAGIVGGEGGEVHVGYSRRRMLASVGRLKALIWAIAVPILALGIIAVSVLSSYLTRPAVKLAEVVRRFGSGDLRARVHGRFGGDIGTLATAFNKMAANLEQQSDQLRYLTDYNQTLIDNLGLGLYVVDSDLRVEYANRRIVEEVGEVEGRICHEVFSGQDSSCDDCIAKRALREGRVETVTAKLSDGRWLEQTAIPIGNLDGKCSAIVTRRDITEAVRLRERITQHEKLAAVGELAAVVAHEVNNPLDGMQSLVSLALDDPATPEGTRGHLEMVLEGLHRIEMIVKRLLTFTADAAEPSQASALRDEVERALLFVQKRLLAAGVEVTKEFEEGLPLVRVDPNRFPQLLVNLLLNAADVMPDGGGLTVRGTRRNGGVRLRVQDQGPGVPPSDRELVFQPFFTTKGPGKGTGLGLAVSRRIAEEHGGTLTVCDAPAGGAAFDLWLPIEEKR